MTKNDEDFKESVLRIAEFVDRYQSAETKLAKFAIKHEAFSALSTDEIILFLDSCIDHLMRSQP